VIETMIYEISNQNEFFNEIASILKPNGQVFLVEPPFHVSKMAFEQTIRKAQVAGFTFIERPKVFLSKSVILIKEISICINVPDRLDIQKKFVLNYLG
jgi:hypothetical protein